MNKCGTSFGLLMNQLVKDCVSCFESPTSEPLVCLTSICLPAALTLLKYSPKLPETYPGLGGSVVLSLFEIY